jgi:hypothetical protein
MPGARSSSSPPLRRCGGFAPGTSGLPRKVHKKRPEKGPQQNDSYRALNVAVDCGILVPNSGWPSTVRPASGHRRLPTHVLTGARGPGQGGCSTVAPVLATGRCPTVHAALLASASQSRTGLYTPRGAARTPSPRSQAYPRLAAASTRGRMQSSYSHQGDSKGWCGACRRYRRHGSAACARWCHCRPPI